MRWSRGDRGNIEDGRGRTGRSMGGGLPLGLGGVVVLLLLSWTTGIDFLSLLGGAGGPSSQISETSGELRSTPQEEEMVDFVDAVAGDTQDVWQQLLGSRYRQTKVFLFRDAVQSGCGAAGSETGPFYCPADGLVYLDLSFFSELDRQFGAPGDFAQAYVIAHEFGHHVQNLLGTSERVGGDRRAPTARRLRSNCRPIATPASGDTRPRAVGASSAAAWTWSRATRRKRCAPLPPSVTTVCSARRPVASPPTASRTARPHSGWSGSSAGCRPAIPASARPSAGPHSKFRIQVADRPGAAYLP